MRRNAVAVGTIVGRTLLASLFIWGGGCAYKDAPDANKPARSGGADRDDLSRIEPQAYRKSPVPMEVDDRGAKNAPATEKSDSAAWLKLGGDKPAEPVTIIAHEVEEDALQTDDAVKSNIARGHADAISDIPTGGTGVVGNLGVGGGGTAGARASRSRDEMLKRRKEAEEIRRRNSLAMRASPGPKRSSKPGSIIGYRGKGAGVARRPGSWQTDLATDELWVIERPGARPNRSVATNEDTPSQGELRAKIRDASGRNVEVPLPLEHTDVKASVSAFVATVDVTQRYRNPYDTKIEAVYVFPLPQNAAVTDFIMTIGKRRIRGIIREREEARKIYREAKRQGYTASLLTQERPNIFTQRVANIEPSKSIGITIRYFNTLKYSEGKYEFVFPMVVGPRYNPPGSRGGVGAVARGRGRTSGQPVEVQYLKPGERSGHDISLTLDVDAGVEVEDVKSHTHAVDIKRPSPSRIRVTLSRLDTIPNKDFVFRYKVAGKKMKTAFLSHTGKKGSHFALVLQPPENMRDLPRMPREMVFVLDCSGSMRGWPMEQAKKAMRRCLTKLGPDDTFQVIRFSNRASSLGPRPLPATSANVRRGLAYVKGLHGSGGTRMIEGIRAALDFPHDPKRLRIVSFMTDGYIGNEKLILAAIHDKLGAARIFSFGVGNSVNRYLLESMARMGKGAVAFVGQGEGATDAVDMFYDRCSRPAMTNIQIDWGSMKVDSVYPRNIPDLFVGRPVIVTGRYQGSGLSSIRVSGRSGFEDSGFTMNVDLDAPEAQHQGIAKVWARKRLAELAAHMTHEPSKEIKNAMTDLSLEYSVQCGYTAFLAVDTSRVTRGASGVTVAVPVPVPDGVRYDTTVGGE